MMGIEEREVGKIATKAETLAMPRGTPMAREFCSSSASFTRDSPYTKLRPLVREFSC